jgi:hypothetical protein
VGFLAHEVGEAPYPEKVPQAQRCKVGLQQKEFYISHEEVDSGTSALPSSKTMGDGSPVAHRLACAVMLNTEALRATATVLLADTLLSDRVNSLPWLSLG